MDPFESDAGDFDLEDGDDEMMLLEQHGFVGRFERSATDSDGDELLEDALDEQILGGLTNP